MAEPPIRPSAAPETPHWLYEILGLIFPFHIRVLWQAGQRLRIAPRNLPARFDGLGDALVRMCPFPAGEAIAAPRVARSAITLPNCPVLAVRYVALPGPELLILALVVDPQASLAPTGPEAIAPLHLTRREATIALQLASGASLTQITHAAGCSLSTTRNLLKSAMRKTGCHTQGELIGLIRVSI